MAADWVMELGARCAFCIYCQQSERLVRLPCFLTRPDDSSIGDYINNKSTPCIVARRQEAEYLVPLVGLRLRCQKAERLLPVLGFLACADCNVVGDGISSFMDRCQEVECLLPLLGFPRRLVTAWLAMTLSADRFDALPPTDQAPGDVADARCLRGWRLPFS